MLKVFVFFLKLGKRKKTVLGKKYQSRPLRTDKAVLTILPKFFRQKSENFSWKSENGWKVDIFGIASIFLKLFPWQRTMQFWQTCGFFSLKSWKYIPELLGKINKSKRNQNKTRLQNVTLDAYILVLTILFIVLSNFQKLPASTPKRKRSQFFKNVSSSKSAFEHVASRINNPAEYFVQSPEMFLFKILKVVEKCWIFSELAFLFKKCLRIRKWQFWQTCGFFFAESSKNFGSTSEKKRRIWL